MSLRRARGFRPPTRFGELVLGLAFLAVAVALVAHAAREGWYGVRSRAWPAAAGRIVASYVREIPRKGPDDHYPVVRYAYVVAGRSYDGDRISFGEEYGSEARASALVRRFPKGAVVRVTYNPASPDVATLLPGLGTLWFVGMIPAGFLLAFCGVYLILRSRNLV